MAEHKIAEKDMIRLVEEVSKLDSERQQMLDKSQVSKILNELNLPSELLDEALERLDAKKAKAKTTNLAIIAGVVGLLIAGAAAFIVVTSATNTANEINSITASHAHMTLSANSAEALATVSPGGTVFVNTTLNNVPLNKKLHLHAKWFRPDGSIFHENDWYTRETTSSTWDTHAKTVIPSDAPSGKWMVQISTGGRELISKIFEVK